MLSEVDKRFVIWARFQVPMFRLFSVAANAQHRQIGFAVVVFQTITMVNMQEPGALWAK